MLRGLNGLASLPRLAQQAEGLPGVRWVDKPAEISALLARYRGSMTGLLVLAQVNSSQAVLATLTYRLASYWGPLCAGPVAYVMFRIRYRRSQPPRTQNGPRP